ncbi:unnamed protein product, partial [Timema podura]|nr:unnamed protein product [Timema podura]
ACIDNNLEMVEFLVKNGADLNRGDNDGWTALHATSNCGFVSIARYLIENGANVAAVNSDAELPIDVAASDDMEDLLQEYITAQGKLAHKDQVASTTNRFQQFHFLHTIIHTIYLPPL